MKSVFFKQISILVLLSKKYVFEDSGSKVEGSKPATVLNPHSTKDEHFEILDVPMVKSTTLEPMSFQLQKFITNFRNIQFF